MIDAIFFGRPGTEQQKEKKKQTLNTVMVFLIAFLFKQSDEKTFLR